MSFLVLGINHNTASVEIREKLSFTPETIPESLASVLELPGVYEAVILSTCNRSEVYCQVERPLSAASSLLNWLAELHQLDVEQLKDSTYLHIDQSAVNHVSRVATGLDSLILGEPQILGQLKDAYELARRYRAVGEFLHSLFQHSFQVAKRVRSSTSIGEHAVSIAYATVTLSARIFSDISQCRVLLVGAGQTTELVARHLVQKNVANIMIANRTLSQAKALASKFNAQYCLLADIPSELPKADIVISSTASPLPLIGKGVVERALKSRKHKPIFMADIAVPRDIEAEVSDLNDVFLYTVDDLRQVVSENIRTREIAAVEAQNINDQCNNQYELKLKARSASEEIRLFRRQAESMKLEELNKAKKALNLGQSVDQVMQRLAHNLTGKLMHAPTVALRKAYEMDHQAMKDIARDMLKEKK